MVAHGRQPSLEQLSTQRRSTTAAALRKGQIKISEPKPLDSSDPSPVWTSSPSHRQSQFPSVYGHSDRPRPTDSVTGFQAPTTPAIGHDSHVAASDFQTGGPLPEPSMRKVGDAAANADAYNVLPPGSSAGDNVSLRHKHSSFFVKDQKDVAGSGREVDVISNNPSSQPRLSTAESVRDPVMDTPTKKKRRSGSIRGAFKRMFSKREKHEKSTPDPEPQHRLHGPRHEYHKSEPTLFPSSRGGLDKVTEEGRTSPEKQMLASQENEYARRSRSPPDTIRLPFPMNINGDQPVLHQLNKEVDIGDQSPQIHRRRATLPSIVLSPTDAATLSQFWKRGSITSPEPVENEHHNGRTPTPLIGLAITSNIASKRRSRSADALRDLAAQQGQSPDMRRRSAEFSYWRSPEQRILEVEEDNDNFLRSHHASILEAPPSEADVNTENAGVSAFDDETIDEATDYHSHGTQQRGSQETQGKDSVVESEPLIRVDQRLSQLELNMIELERSMQALSGQRPASQTFKLEKPPPSRGRRSGEFNARDHLGLPNASQNSVQLGRSASMKIPPSPKVLHPRPSPSLHDINPHFDRSADPDRVPTAVPHDGASPFSSSFSTRRQTIRETMTPPGQVQNFSTPFPASKESPSRIIDQLAPLYSALQYERGVRKQLEITVIQLQRDMLNLTNIIAEMRGIGAYPTPSPDHILGVVGNYRKTGTTHSPPTLVHGSDDDADVSDGLAGEYDTLNSPTNWATPREDRQMSNEEWRAHNEMF